ncbi:MAG: glycogen/starch synthase [Chitinispirillaceae bacterium]
MLDEEIQHIFTTKTNSWVPMRAPLHLVFDEHEREMLVAARNKFDTTKRKVIFLSFENKYAACGGLAAVARYLPEQLALKGEQLCIVSPFYPNQKAVKEALDRGQIIPEFHNLSVNIGETEYNVYLYKDNSPSVVTFFIGVEGFFQAQNDPYDYADNQQLLIDALVYAAVLPSVLQKIGMTDNLILHANDWETALVAISSKKALFSGMFKHANTVLTLHNSFDSHLPEQLAEHFLGIKPLGQTVLQSSLPFLDSPLTTVSTAFACELRNDPIQCQLFTPHLQNGFGQNPPIGIENGLFGKTMRLRTSKTTNSAEHEMAAILKDKKQKRRKLEKYLLSPPGNPVYGSITFRRGRGQVPVFFMSGRLDLAQKGFDVIFRAFRRLSPGSAKLVFTPSNPRNGNEHQLSFFKNMCVECSGDITIWPYRVDEKIYHECLSGASFLIMPSFYEPFGAATEGFLHGTPVIARATGGLISQVNSVIKIQLPAFYGHFASREATDAKPNGILYREETFDENASEQWRTILSLSVERRDEVPIYNRMVDAASQALETALSVYHDQVRYATIIRNGMDSLHRFSWESSVNRYRTIYDLTASGR